MIVKVITVWVIHTTFVSALFNKIKPFMSPEEDHLYHDKLEKIGQVFQESVQSNQRVIIM